MKLMKKYDWTNKINTLIALMNPSISTTEKSIDESDRTKQRFCHRQKQVQKNFPGCNIWTPMLPREHKSRFTSLGLQYLVPYVTEWFLNEQKQQAGV